MKWVHGGPCAVIASASAGGARAAHGGPERTPGGTGRKPEGASLSPFGRKTGGARSSEQPVEDEGPIRPLDLVEAHRRAGDRALGAAGRAARGRARGVGGRGGDRRGRRGAVGGRGAGGAAGIGLFAQAVGEGSAAGSWAQPQRALAAGVPAAAGCAAPVCVVPVLVPPGGSSGPFTPQPASVPAQARTSNWAGMRKRRDTDTSDKIAATIAAGTAKASPRRSPSYQEGFRRATTFPARRLQRRHLMVRARKADAQIADEMPRGGHLERGGERRRIEDVRPNRRRCPPPAPRARGYGSPLRGIIERLGMVRRPRPWPCSVQGSANTATWQGASSSPASFSRA